LPKLFGRCRTPAGVAELVGEAAELIVKPAGLLESAFLLWKSPPTVRELPLPEVERAPKELQRPSLHLHLPCRRVESLPEALQRAITSMQRGPKEVQRVAERLESLPLL
jgi:hypothetical protein